MDSATQLILGAAVGYAVAGKHIGKRAFLWGAIAGTAPDLDFIPTLPFDDPFVYLKHHRGFSHSLVFCALAPVPLAWLARKVRPSLPFRPIAWLLFWVFLTHTLLDCFTTWGTQLLWPLARREAWNTVFIIDPLYTIPLLLGLIVALFLNTHEARQKWVVIGLAVSSAYLVWSVGAKWMINARFEALFRHHQIPVQRYTTRPSPFNTILWSATAETADGYYYGMVSLLDRQFQGPLYFTPKRLGISLPADRSTQELIGYTKGYYALERLSNGVRIHDLRYGFMGDPWQNGPTPVFSYDLEPGAHGRTVLTIHNPRPQNTQVLLHQLWKRLQGIQSI